MITLHHTDSLKKKNIYIYIYIYIEELKPQKMDILDEKSIFEPGCSQLGQREWDMEW